MTCVNLPAGTFKAFRLQSSPGLNDSFEDRAAGRSWNPIETTWTVEAYEDIVVPRWYAPDVKLVVKQIVERAPHHFRGVGKSTVARTPVRQLAALLVRGQRRARPTGSNRASA